MAAARREGVEVVFMFRHLAIRDQVVAPPPVGFPGEHVAVERDPVPELDHRARVRPGVHQPQDRHRNRKSGGVREHDETRLPGDRNVGDVPYRTRPDDGKIQVRDFLDPPYREGLAEVLLVTLEPHAGRDVDEPDEAERRVDHEPQRVLESLLDLALQEVVEDHVGIGEIVDEVRHPVADGPRGDPHVRPRERSEQGLVEEEAEPMRHPVGPLQRIARLRVLRVRRNPRQSQRHGQKTGRDPGGTGRAG